MGRQEKKLDKKSSAASKSLKPDASLDKQTKKQELLQQKSPKGTRKSRQVNGLEKDHLQNTPSSSTQEEKGKLEADLSESVDESILFSREKTNCDDDDPLERETETCCASCSKVCKTRCTGCRMVFYCDRECQKRHWKEHRDICRPYLVNRSKDLGRHLAASRDLKTDDLILQDEPLVIGLRQGSEPVCLSCYRRITGDYVCSKCTWPLCSVSCEDGVDHAAECGVTRRSGIIIKVDDFDTPNHLYEVVTALRCLVAFAKEPRKWLTGIERMNTRYMHLIDTPQYVHQQRVVLPALKELLKGKLEPYVDISDSEIQKTLGILQVNSVPTKLPQAEVQGLYPLASLLSHSCAPNTRLIWDDATRTLTVKASEEIPKGETITTIYTDILWGTRARRDDLQQTRSISCSCLRCKDPTEMGSNFSALVCRRCPKRSSVLPMKPLDSSSPWMCKKCLYQVDAEEVHQTTLAIGAAVSDALSIPTIESLEALQQEWATKVHPHHYHLHALKHSLLQLYGRTQEGSDKKDDTHWVEITKKEKACKEFLKVCSLLDPALAYTIPFVGLTFFEYHKTILQNAKKNFGLAKINTQQLKKRMLLAKALLKKAMEIFRNEASDTPEGQLYLTCQQEVIAIGRWMLAVGLI